MKRLWMTLGVVASRRAGSPLRRWRRTIGRGSRAQITDESRGALPGVTVTLQNEATGVATDRVTDAEGRYLFDFVEPGTYSVSAAAAGIPRRPSRRPCACRSAAT